MKYLSYIALALVSLYAVILRCNGHPSDDKALKETSASLHQALVKISGYEAKIDSLTATALEASQFTMEAYRQVDTLKTKLSKAQVYASGLAEKHWQARDNKDTVSYMRNCDEMAGQLSDSRDSVHNLMAEINSYKYGVNDFQGKYLVEHATIDSLRAALSFSKNEYKKLAGKAIDAFDTTVSQIISLHKPRVFIGGSVQVPFGIGPQVLVQTGNKIYSASVLAGNQGTVYQASANILLSLKRPSLLKAIH